MELSKKVANNILDFLIDPTKVPVTERIYIGPEEKLQNAVYEKAKADACATFKDQKHNSDFYPNKKSPLTREANIMDRKSLIASLDVLSRNFKDASDPIATDLQNMAIALSRMDDETLQARLASDAPELDEVLAAKTFKCPSCGTNVLEQTKYCVKCKKKVMPKTADDEACDKGEEDDKTEKDAMLLPGQRTDVGQRFPGSSMSVGGPKIKSVYDEKKDEIEKSPWLKKLFDGLMTKTAAEEQAEEKDAMLMTGPQKEIGKRFPGSSSLPGGGKPNSVYNMYEDNKANIEKTPWLKKLFEGLMSSAPKTAEDFWTKEASDIVARALVAEIIGVTADDDKPAEAPAKEAPKAVETPAAEADVKKTDDKPAEPKAEEPKEAKVEEKVVPKEAKAEEKVEEPKAEKEAVSETAKVVDTDVLASYTFAGIEVPMNFVDEAGDMTADEKANLAKLF